MAGRRGKLQSTCSSSALQPGVQRGLDNGRSLQELLHQAAPRYSEGIEEMALLAPKLLKKKSCCRVES